MFKKVCCSIVAMALIIPVAASLGQETQQKTKKKTITTQTKEAVEKLKDDFNQMKNSLLADPKEQTDELLKQLEANKDLNDNKIQVDVCNILIKRISAAKKGLQNASDSNPIAAQDAVVIGYKGLSQELQNFSELMMEKSKNAKTAARKAQYMKFANVGQKFSTTYQGTSNKYKELPIRKQLQEIDEQIEYLDDMKSLIVIIRDTILPMEEYQDTIDDLKDVIMELNDLNQNIYDFANILMQKIMEIEKRTPQNSPIT